MFIFSDNYNFFSKVRVWTQPNYIDYAEFALSITGEIIEAFEEWTGIKYPLEKTGTLCPGNKILIYLIYIEPPSCIPCLPVVPRIFKMRLKSGPRSHLDFFSIFLSRWVDKFVNEYNYITWILPPALMFGLDGTQVLQREYCKCSKQKFHKYIDGYKQ